MEGVQLEWLADNESSLSAIAAIIAIITGLAVVFRLVWVRMVARKRPTFLSDWRNIGLLGLAFAALSLLGILALSPDESEQSGDNLDASGKPSVAVLPLDNISGDPEQEYLADGIAEDVITLLSRNPRFFVIARNSTFSYKGQSPDIRTVGEELGVRYVVEGSLRKIGERLRVTVQLIEAASGQHVWAEQYDRPFTEIFALQDEITNGIAVALGDEIFQAEIARASSTPTDNLDAWGLVMRASQALNNWSNESSAKAAELFRAALELDPDYALAQAELTRTLCWRVANLWSDDPEADIAESYRLGEQALQWAPNDPMVLFGVGACYGSTGRVDEGIRLLKKAISKQPNFAMAMGTLAYSLGFNDQAEQGIVYGDNAVKLAPHSPYIWLYESWRTFGLLELGHYETTEKAAQNALQSYDGWWWTWLHLAAAHAGQGDIEGAKEALYSARQKEPKFSLAFYKNVAGVIYKNKGKNVLALLEPIWPEDLLTTDEKNE